MKRLSQILVLVAVVLSSIVVNAQDSNNPWMVRLGMNAVDFYPTGQKSDDANYISDSFGKDFFNFEDHYNMAYALSDVRVARHLGSGFSLEGSFKFNKITKIGDKEASDAFINPNLDIKYNFLQGTTIDPYLFAGGGYTWLDKADAGNLNGGVGINFWFNENLGLYVESAYKHTFDKAILPYFQHSIGLAVKFGGSDKDGDGVYDRDDACPDVAGLEKYQGCPDSDGDGVIDSEDDCPQVAGLAALKGCPDADGDGIADAKDDCPQVAGLAALNGCPDKDGDGVTDAKDKCPNEAGPAENAGCPWTDKDKDGVLDKDDKCPEEAGPVSNNGCPEKVITVEAKAELDKFAKAIYFNSGKSTFRPGVTEKLDLIVDIMKKYDDSKFRVEGYTDSVGSAKLNQGLSERRAAAVLDYLVSHGIAGERLSSVGYGEDNPIASNKTRAGRAKNRRVEINLMK